ncbi:MAG TPA: carbohydrate ABC transporter permease [Desulfobacterales bacterium]|nr:carbohydrate ABC transporter permease [Desulfobacterales bacterium]
MWLLIQWTVIIIFLCLTTIPFAWLIMASFKTNIELFSNPFGLSNWTFANYAAVFSHRPMHLYFRNSIVVTIISTAVAVIASTLASYVFTYRFRAKRALYIFLIVGLFLPVNAFMTPYFFIVNWLGLYDTLWGVALVYAGISMPLSLLVIKTYMDTIPQEIIEAARIDGANFHQIFWNIILPLSRPGIVTASIFLMITAWNELLFANLLTQSDVNRTVQVAIRFFLTTFEANYARAMAGTVVSILPTIVAYMFLSNRIMEGLTVGAVK